MTFNPNQENKTEGLINWSYIFKNRDKVIGGLIWKLILAAFFFGAVTGSSVVVDSIWSYFNPLFWGSVTGKSVGEIARDANEDIITPLNAQMEENSRRVVSIDAETGDVRGSEEPEFSR